METIEVSVSIQTHSGSRLLGVAEVRVLTEQKAFIVGAKRSAKMIGLVFLAALPFGFIEPFLFMIWGGGLLLLLVTIVGPGLHLYFAKETHSFIKVRIECPHCHSMKGLVPYLHTRFDSVFTALCSECGQTSRVERRMARDDGPSGAR